MAKYTYTSTWDDFTVESDVIRPDLEREAEWVRSGGDDAPVGAQGEDIVLARVSSPSGTPEESLSGDPFPTGEPNPARTVNVPSPEAAFRGTAYEDQVQVYPTHPSKFFDGGDGREASGIDLLGIDPASIQFQGDPETQVKPTYPATVESGLGSTPRAQAEIFPTGSDANPDGTTPQGDGVNPDAEAVAELEESKAAAAAAAESQTSPAAPEAAPEHVATDPEVVGEAAAANAEAIRTDLPAGEPIVEVHLEHPAPVDEGVQDGGAAPVNPDEVNDPEPAPSGNGAGGNLDDGTDGAQGAHVGVQGDPTTVRPRGNASTDEWLAAYEQKAGRAFPFQPDVDGEKPAREDVITAFDALSEGAND